MSLYQRLLGAEKPRIPVHSFIAALGELERGKITRAQVLVGLGIAADEEADFDAIVAKINPAPESLAIGGRFAFTNIGTAYQALGMATIESGGITAVEFAVACNRNGAAGTVSWQLFDITNTTELTVINDTSGAGEKVVATSSTFGSPLAKGLRRISVRCKSTTVADDPIFLGASLLIRRLERMSALELHEVLLLAEQGLYGQEFAIRTRLGT